MITIKNIIFDLGGVILKSNPISTLDKLNIDKETYNELKSFFERWEDLNLGNETLEEKYNKCHFKNDKYKEYLLNYYKYRENNMDIIDCINKLKKNNYNIYILSCNNKECFDYCKNNPLFKNIDYWVLSCDYHSLKEDGKLCDILIDKYNLNVNECYYVDDYYHNIEEAEKRGIKSFLFNENIDELYYDMKKNGIKI